MKVLLYSRFFLKNIFEGSNLGISTESENDNKKSSEPDRVFHSIFKTDFKLFLKRIEANKIASKDK